MERLQTDSIAREIDYLRIAYYLASKESPDLSTQNAALLVDPESGQILAYGVNTFPRGVNLTHERLSRKPDKYLFTEHAERNAIYDAAKRGIKTAGLTMYCPWSACADCGRAIIQSGVALLVIHKIPEHDRPDWQASIKVAFDMFDEAHVPYRFITDKIGGVEIRFGARLLKP